MHAPSHLDEESRAEPVVAVAAQSHVSLRRGTLAHRLLHLLSALPDVLRAQAAHNYLAVRAQELSAEEQTALVNEILSVMRHAEFADAFSADALAEAPVIGVVDGRRLAGQIDRLIVRPDEVIAVDFKSGRVPEDGVIPVAYMRQMQAYRALLEGVYPNRPVRCALLYIAGPTLVPIA